MHTCAAALVKGELDQIAAASYLKRTGRFEEDRQAGCILPCPAKPCDDP